MNKEQVIKQIYADLQLAVDPVYKEGATRYFKEDVKIYGVRIPNVRTIAANYATVLKKEPLQELWQLSELLLQTGYTEDACIALAIVYKRKAQWGAHDFTTLEHWVHSYVSNWAICDDISTHLVGYCIGQYPQVLPTVRSWANSDNRWVRRSAAVSLIAPVRKGHNLDDVFHIADTLLHDTDDMVQKGCGWMLKEATKCNQAEIVTYVEKHKKSMPRTMLRYAIELLPADIKKRLMAV